MPHHHLNKPALCAVLAGGFISCTALVFPMTAPANAQSPTPTAEPERSDIDLTPLTPGVSGEAGSISLSTSYARLADVSTFAEGSDRRFILDNPMAQAVPLSGAIAQPAARSFQDSPTEIVEYTLIGDALQDSGALTGFAGISGRTRDERDWRNVSNTPFAGAGVQNPLGKQNVAARSYGFYENSVVYGENADELSPLYFRPLTERLNLSVHTYIGYEDTNPGNSDPTPYTGVGLTVSREAWPK